MTHEQHAAGTLHVWRPSSPPQRTSRFLQLACFAPDKVHALLTLARDHLASIDHPNQLTWD